MVTFALSRRGAAKTAARCFFLSALLLGCVGGARGEDFADKMTDAHNADRAEHGVAPLVWSESLAAGARQWARACTTAGGGFAHSPGAFSTYGENLAWGTGFTAARAVALWYAEGANYDYSNPIASFNTGTVLHFTQLIWRGSQKLGCGEVLCGGQRLYVCRYTPPGNFNATNPGVLAKNVPPPIH
jgi:uncharacterized protein YkwD